MKKSILCFGLILIICIFVLSGYVMGSSTDSDTTTSYEAVMDSYTYSLDYGASSSSTLYSLSWYESPSERYEFIDDDGNYNVVFSLKSTTDQLGWITIDLDTMEQKSIIYIDAPLSMFGNALYHEGYLYVTYGENDTTTDDDTSSDYASSITIEIVKYDTSGNIIEELPLEGYETSLITSSSSSTTWKGYGTQYPFYAGNCDMAVDDDTGVIKIVFSKTMYNGHTMAYTMYIDEDLNYLSRPSTMTTDNEYYYLSNSYYWVSHSLGERVIATSDSEFLTINQGDANPRAFYLTKSYVSAKNNKRYYSTYEVFHFKESSDASYAYNTTYANLGNIIEVSDGYMFIADSATTLSINFASSRSDTEPRNIFIQKYSKDLTDGTEKSIQLLDTDVRTSETSRTSVSSNGGSLFLSSTGETDYGVLWLTDYEEEDEATVGGTRGIYLEDKDEVLIIWAERGYDFSSYKTSGSAYYYYEIIDTEGNVVQDPVLINQGTPTNLINYVYADGYIYWSNYGSGDLIINKLDINSVSEEAYIEIQDEDGNSTDSITIEDSDITIYQLIANTNSDNNITWSSTNTSVATVDENGLVTILKNGTAKIKAVVDGYTTDMSDSVSITVDYKVKSVTLTTSSPVSIKEGATKYIYYTVSPSTAATRTLTWTSSDESIVTISSSNTTYVKVTSGEQGTATLTGVTNDGSNITVEVTVIVYDPITEITLDSSSVTLNVGDTYTIGYSITPSDSLESITFSSMDESVVTVDEDGVVSTVGTGSTYVYLKSSKKSTYIKVKVVNPIIAVAFEKTAYRVAAGDTTTLSINTTAYNTSYDTTDTIKSTTYSSSDTSIVKVSSAGVITGVSDGTAIITATVTTSSDTYTATATVVVGDGIMGDFDNDEDVDLTDVLIAIKIYFEKIEATSYHLSIGDFDGDGTIALSDVLYEIKLYFDQE